MPHRLEPEPGGAARAGRIESVPVVAHLQDDPAAICLQEDTYVAGRGVLHRVSEGFLGHPQDGVLERGGEDDRVQVGRDLDPESLPIGFAEFPERRDQERLRPPASSIRRGQRDRAGPSRQCCPGLVRRPTSPTATCVRDRGGATGYLLKDTPRAALLQAVRVGAVLAPAVASRLMGRLRAPEQEPPSQRELEVLELVAADTTNKEAAARLLFSEATVKTHPPLHIFAKLGVNDRAAAVAEAFNRGLLRV